jgi:hypothetical protein
LEELKPVTSNQQPITSNQQPITSNQQPITSNQQHIYTPPMKHILFIVCLFTIRTSFSQDTTYWQQEVHYNIDVTLNDQKHTLKGLLNLEYINHSPDTLNFIWFHIWPNAYRNQTTALAKQLAGGKSASKKDNGFIDSLNFSVNNQPVTTEAHPQYIDVVKLILPQALLPGQKINISTPFFVDLPGYYSRSGHAAQQYMVCQWYPKPAVYDRKGWHEMPYLDQGEFYSEFGSFKVNITLPSSYVVGATGKLQTKSELDEYKRIGAANYRNPEKPLQYRSTDPGKPKTLEYFGENIHDFAWFADEDFIIQYDTLRLSSDSVIDVFSYYQSNGNKEWRNSIGFIEDAVRKYSDWIGEYPYPTVAAVEGPKNQSSGGMEYPMITLITSPDATKESLDAVIAHEVGHNWFYGIIASNEREFPWMDEGLNTYYQFRYEADKYRTNSIFGSSIPDEVKKLSSNEFLSRVYNALNTLPAAKPVATSSTGFQNKDEYGIVVYIKTAIWMFIMESSVGREALDKGIQTYFNEWKFKHPYPEDLQSSLEKGTGQGFNNLFELLKQEGNFK